MRLYSLIAFINTANNTKNYLYIACLKQNTTFIYWFINSIEYLFNQYINAFIYLVIQSAVCLSI